MTVAGLVHALTAFRHSGEFADLWLIYLFRVLPFAIYGLYKLRTMPAAVAVLFTLSAAIICTIGGLPPPFILKLWLVCMTLLYFVAITACLHVFAVSTRASAALKVALLPVLFMLCAVVPAKALPLVKASLVVIIAHGFELTLAGYSYCCAVWSSPKRPRLEESFFFMLVTPEVVFPLRGTACQSRPVRGLGRALVGAALMATVVGLKTMLEFGSPPLRAASFLPGIISGAIGLVLLYASHSALAHIQIGLCRVVGYAAPERYHFPLAAVSPGDFWTRWNRYFSLWLRCYVYPGLVRVVRNRGPRLLRITFATLGAFLFLGVFHDLYWLVVDGRIVTTGTAGFLFWGVQLCVWKPIESWLAGPRSMTRAFARGLSRVAFMTGICFSTWVFL